ncbi:MAG: 23S rRNA (uracil(1939)-C(5))-methyltransferase RlmD [Chlamydiales bacterium]|nr:23S rRNA (uracil(1939)-C(5))-methyltransferase RlmD [Chlamydiales bacterium]
MQEQHPLCPHLDSCGGCSTQATAYSEQLKKKSETIEQLFSALGLLEGVKLDEIIPCRDPWRYRNKMEFSFSQNKAQDHFLGLMLKRSGRRVLNVEECYLTSPWFTKTLNSVRDWWKSTQIKAYHPYANTGSLRTLTLREGKRTQDKMAILTVSGQSDFALTKDQLDGFVNAVKRVVPEEEQMRISIFLRIQQIQKGSPTQFFEMLLSGPDHITERLEIEIEGKKRIFTFKISPTSFFQPNSLQAEILYGRALEMCAVTPEMHVLDLYCGTATLGMVFAERAGRVTGIELNPEATFDAESNLERNGTKNMEIHCGDVGKILKSWEDQALHPDLVIVDPPRAGLDPTSIAQILRLAPKKILYVSCNPATQAQNVKVFIENGYKLLKLQPVDQFPHTPHLESIALLSFP